MFPRGGHQCASPMSPPHRIGDVSLASPFVSPLAPDANAGRVALVTGGGTGIGRATALALAYTGADVVICGRREEPLITTAREIEQSGASCLAVPADIREPEQVDRLVDAA